jgi:hypothetical protein
MSTEPGSVDLLIRRVDMLELTALNVLCLVAVGFALAIVAACALFTRIAASQKGAIGCFVLVGIFFCLLAGLLLSVGLSS